MSSPSTPPGATGIAFGCGIGTSPSNRPRRWAACLQPPSFSQHVLHERRWHSLFAALPQLGQAILPELEARVEAMVVEATAVETMAVEATVDAETVGCTEGRQVGLGLGLAAGLLLGNIGTMKASLGWSGYDGGGPGGGSVGSTKGTVCRPRSLLELGMKRKKPHASTHNQ